MEKVEMSLRTCVLSSSDEGAVQLSVGTTEVSPRGTLLSGQPAPELALCFAGRWWSLRPELLKGLSPVFTQCPRTGGQALVCGKGVEDGAQGGLVQRRHFIESLGFILKISDDN